MTATVGILIFAGGYVASVYTWEPFHTWLIGAKAKIDALKARIEALKAKL